MCRNSLLYENSGVGVGIPDIGRCNLIVIDGKVHIRTSAACIGQGLGTILTQIICETIGLLPEQIILDLPDTKFAPDSGTTTASRQTVFTGEATRMASLKLKEKLLTTSLEECEGEEFYGEYQSITDPINSDKRIQ